MILVVCAAAVLNGAVGWSPEASLPSNRLYDATVVLGLTKLKGMPVGAFLPPQLPAVAESMKSQLMSDLSWCVLFGWLALGIVSRARPNARAFSNAIVAVIAGVVGVLAFRTFRPGHPPHEAALSEQLVAIQSLNAYINTWFVPPSIREAIKQHLPPYYAHVAETYLRTLLAGSGLYWSTSLAWSLYIHFRVDKTYFTTRWPSIQHQIVLSQLGMFVYAMLPPLSEVLVETGWTKCYMFPSYVGGWGPLVLYQCLYLALVEVGVYWMHRSLHTNKFLFNHVHALHHKYNHPEELSPWASVAFHPLDGMLQAAPYVVCIFLFPCNYFVHLCHLFFTAMWATNIHDVVHADSEPIMGAKYHTVHHTHLRYNHGQFFIFCDWYWGTLRLPASKQRMAGANKKVQ